MAGQVTFGLVSSLAAALAFFPPEAYKRRVRARAGAGAAVAGAR